MIYKLGFFFGLIGSVLGRRRWLLDEAIGGNTDVEKPCEEIAASSSQALIDEGKRLDTNTFLRPKETFCESCTDDGSGGKSINLFLSAQIEIQDDVQYISALTQEEIDEESDKYWKKYIDPAKDIHWIVKDCDNLFDEHCQETKKLTDIFKISRAILGTTNPFGKGVAKDYVKIRYRLDNNDWIDLDAIASPKITFRGAIRVIEFRAFSPCGMLIDNRVFTVHRHKATLCYNLRQKAFIALMQDSKILADNGELTTIPKTDYAVFQFNFNAEDVSGSTNKEVVGIECSFKYDGYVNMAGSSVDVNVDPATVVSYTGDDVRQTYGVQLLTDTTHPITRASIECTIDYKDRCKHYCIKQTKCTKRFTAKDAEAPDMGSEFAILAANVDSNVPLNGLCAGNIVTYNNNQTIFHKASDKNYPCTDGTQCKPLAQPILSDLNQCQSSLQ